MSTLDGLIWSRCSIALTCPARSHFQRTKIRKRWGQGWDERERSQAITSYRIKEEVLSDKNDFCKEPNISKPLHLESLWLLFKAAVLILPTNYLGWRPVMRREFHRYPNKDLVVKFYLSDRQKRLLGGPRSDI